MAVFPAAANSAPTTANAVPTTADAVPTPASPRLRRLRSPSSGVRAGTYPYLSREVVVTGWHVHDFHQIEYALDGVVQVETSAARYLLPPQQAVWIPAGLAHNTTLRNVRTVSVFMQPDLIEGMSDRARIFRAEPLFREMLRHAARWPIDRADREPEAEAFFGVLATLVAHWLQAESPFHLPRSDDPVLAGAMTYTDQHLERITLTDVCSAVRVSPRTLRRRFTAETGLTWRTYLLHSRLLRAMALLTEPHPTVAAIATRVGFNSASAFTRAFLAYTGHTPSQYRQGVR